MVAARTEDQEGNHLPLMADLPVAAGVAALQEVVAHLHAVAPMAEEVVVVIVMADLQVAAGVVAVQEVLAHLHAPELLPEMENAKEVLLHVAEAPASELKEK